MDTLFAPLGPLPRHLEPFRVWIWLQIVMIRAYVRAVRGKGVLFSTLVDRRGHVTLNWIGKAPEALTPDPFSFAPSKAYQLAFAGPAPAHPGEGRGLVPLAVACQPWPLPGAHDIALPLPDT